MPVGLRTKLLEMVMDAIEVAPPNTEREAQAAIDAVASWFEDVLDVAGVTPSSIPTLLQWQAHQHEYLNHNEE